MVSWPTSANSFISCHIQNHRGEKKHSLLGPIKTLVSQIFTWVTSSVHTIQVQMSSLQRGVSCPLCEIAPPCSFMSFSRQVWIGPSANARHCSQLSIWRKQNRGLPCPQEVYDFAEVVGWQNRQIRHQISGRRNIKCKGLSWWRKGRAEMERGNSGALQRGAYSMDWGWYGALIRFIF